MKALLEQTRVELLLSLRRGEGVLVSMVIPAAVLAFFWLVRAGGTDGESSVDALLPGVLSIAVIASSMVALGIATGYERHYRVLKRLGTTPLTRPRLLLAKTIAVLAIEVLQVILLIAIAAALGWRGAPNPAALSIALGIGTLCFSSIGFLLAGTLRAEVNLAVTNALFLTLLLLGGSVVALSALPGPLSTVAQTLPAARLTELFEWGLSYTGFPTPAFGVIVAWAGGAMLGATATFSWE